MRPHDADARTSICNRWNCLAFAAYFQHLAVIRLLLEYSADVHQTDNRGYSPLLLAAQQGNAATLDLLLGAELGVNHDGVKTSDWTPLMLCARRNHLDAARSLCRAGGDPSHSKSDGVTALQVAAHEGCVEMIKLLVELGATVVSPDVSGKSPRDIAEREGHLKAVDYLDRVAYKL